MLTVPLGHELANFEPALTFAHEQTPAPRFWLWPRRLALGTFSLLVGDPGVGKSLLVADIAARVSAGRPWADPPPVDSVCDDPGYATPPAASAPAPAPPASAETLDPAPDQGAQLSIKQS